MSIPSSAVRLALCAAVVAACSHSAPPVTPTPQAAGAQAAAAPGQVNMAGDWSFQLLIQGQEPAGGILQLSPTSDGYTGNLRFDAANRPYFIRAVLVEGNHVRMVLDTPDGDARIEGNLRAPTQFEGIYISRTLNGRFTATRR